VAVFQVYFTVTSASTFAGAFTLTAMSADRCVAVCCPVSSRNGCRTLALARLIIMSVWVLAIAAVFPVTLYAQLVPTSRGARSAPLCTFCVVCYIRQVNGINKGVSRGQ